MQTFPKPIQVVVYQDVLCAWCYVMEPRLQSLRSEFRELVRWKTRPFPLRLGETRPSERELDELTRDIEQARNEPEGRQLRADLWTQENPPCSSVPALAALEAARLQGSQAHALLGRAMQRAALEEGVNVTRSDVVFELASRLGLEMNRFAAAFQSPETQRLILQEHRLAAERGIKALPTLVIEGRWMISGLRPVEEYREHIAHCLQRAAGAGPRARERVVH